MAFNSFSPHFFLDKKVPKNQGLSPRRPTIGLQAKQNKLASERSSNGILFYTPASPSGFPVCGLYACPAFSPKKIVKADESGLNICHNQNDN